MQVDNNVPAVDRSVPRAALKAGDRLRDGRGRVRSTPPILHYGFRPFFFLASLHAGLVVPFWVWAYLGGHQFGGPFDGLLWHAHEMLFGFLAAVVAGFILTAIPNWTGRLPLSGTPLAVLVGLWLAARAGCLLLTSPWLAATVDLAFPATLAFAIWREVVAGRNWKNVPVAALVALFGCANLLDHLSAMGIAPHDSGQRLALAVITLLIALIGGRIVPSFTRNWLSRTGAARLPAPFGMPDRLALAATVAAMLTWLFFPDAAVAGVLLCVAGGLLALRLARWRGLAARSEPIVAILHLGYGWLALALLLLGLAALTPYVPATAAIHALTAGAVGTMTLAVMTRASLGHTGRPIVADPAVVLIYLLVTVGALLRVSAPFSGDGYATILASGGGLWSSAFLLFAVRYAPILWGPRAGT